MNELLKLSKSDLLEKGNDASKNGDITFFEDIIEFKLKKVFINNSYVDTTPFNLFSIACQNKQINLLEYFLNSPNWNSAFNNFFILSETLREACITENIEVIKYILDEQKIKDKNKLYDFILDSAAFCGNVNIIKYVLDKFGTNPSIQLALINGRMLNNACDYGHLNILQYFFESKWSKNGHRDILQEDLFKIAHKNNNIEIIQYLIMNLNLKKNKTIKKELKDKPSFEVERLFTARELTKSLEKELPNDSSLNIKKIKL